MSEVEKLRPFYDYARLLAGPYDSERIQPEDVHPACSPMEAAEQLAAYMADWAGDERWGERTIELAALIKEGRHRYFHGYVLGDVAADLGQDEGLLLRRFPWGEGRTKAIKPFSGVPKVGLQHLDGYRDWTWKVSEPGTFHRPHDDGREVPDPELPRDWVPHDYSDYIACDDRFEAEWPDTREHLFAKPRVSDEAAGQQQDRRARGVGKDPEKARRAKQQRTQPQYGVLRHYLGDFRPRRVGTVPFYSVWLLARDFWRDHMGNDFRVNFAQAHDKSIGQYGRMHPKTGRLLGPDAAWCSAIEPARLNAASHFWAALCGKIEMLLDFDEMTPDPELWAYIRSNTGEAAGEAQIEPASLGEIDLLDLERQRILLIAERTERWARDAHKAAK